jgi:hypothetical protein
LVDAFAHEYHWSVEQILELPITGVTLLVQRICARYPKPEGQKDDVISVEEFASLMRVE